MTPSPVRYPALGVVLAGRYRILEKIGSGGISEVYRAVDELSPCAVTVKFLRSSTPSELDQAVRCVEAARAVHPLRQTNIAQVLDTGYCEYGHYIVVEDLRGENIGRLLARHGRLHRHACFAIIEPVLLALAAAHTAGIQHGNIKPSNVLVCQTADFHIAVKLLDFGAPVAGPIDRSPAGASLYFAPEQLEGRGVDLRSDLFSVCLILVELLTNAQPFHGSSAAITSHRIVHLPCPTLEQMGLANSDALSKALLTGLEKEAFRRYSSARELLEALRPLMQGDVLPTTLLADLLPLSALLRQDSGTMLASPNTTASSSQRPRPSSIPGPESGARLSTTTPRSVLPGPSSRPETTSSPELPERDPIGSVLPSRYRGRYRVRAIVWQSLDSYVRSRRPADLRERILYDVGGDEASDLLLGTLSGIVHCALDSVCQYVELATSRLFSNEPAWCRAAGREAVEGVLANALTRSIPPTPNVLITLRRTCRVLGPMFDFGDWQVEQADDLRRAQVAISGIDPLCQGLRLWIVGSLERSLAVVHQRPTLNIIRGENSFMPRMVIDVATGHQP